VNYVICGDEASGQECSPDEKLFNIGQSEGLMLFSPTIAYLAHRVSVKVRGPFSQKRLQSPDFDAQLFLTTAGLGRSIRNFHKEETVFAQGDLARNVMYIQEGGVKLTVVSATGKVVLRD
jgi:CRP-like cAMP-binding protein